MGLKLTDYIQFMEFNSKKENLLLLDRDAPTPSEKEIIKDLPYKQGVLDFSMLLGDRVFNNRDITYNFLLLETSEKDIYFFETKLKQKLMRYGQQKIHDSHDPYYYWYGKCKSVKAERNATYNRLQVTIVFDCYPYMFSNTNYFDDSWEHFDLKNDVANYTKYEIKGSLDFPLYNSGSVSTRPDVIVDTKMIVTVNGEDPITFEPGDSKNFYLSLKPGVNDIHVEGNGIIRFHFQSEVMG